jgi:hypothetical protein
MVVLRHTFCAIFTLLLLASCTNNNEKSQEENFVPTPQQQAEDAIKTWMFNNPEYSQYKPIVFGDLTPRFDRNSRTLQLSIQIGEEEAVSKETGEKDRLDSLKRIMYKNKSDMLGFIILHKFQEINLAGEIEVKERLFFLDTAFRVATVLTPESFDYILNERVFYRLDTID